MGWMGFELGTLGFQYLNAGTEPWRLLTTHYEIAHISNTAPFLPFVLVILLDNREQRSEYKKAVEYTAIILCMHPFTWENAY